MEATVNKYELLFEKVDIPNIIPFFEDHDLTVRLEYGLGTAGAKIHLVKRWVHPLKEGDRLGASAEGSVVDGKKPIINDGEWRMKALSGKIDLNLPYSFDAVKEDLMAGNIIGAKIEGTALENSFQTKVPILFPWGISEREVTITQKVGEGNFAVGVEEYSAKLATEVTTNKYEAEVNILHIPDFIPFIGDHDVIAKGEVGLGTAGFKVQLGAETGAYFGEAFGLGGFIKVEKTKEES